MKTVYITTDGTEFSTKEAALEYQNMQDHADAEFVEQRKAYLLLQAEYELIEEKIAAFQEQCSHKYVKIRPGSSTGNWCKSDDSYWYNITCKCCDKNWSEDQSNKYSSSNPNIEWIK